MTEYRAVVCVREFGIEKDNKKNVIWFRVFPQPESRIVRIDSNNNKQEYILFQEKENASKDNECRKAIICPADNQYFTISQKILEQFFSVPNLLLLKQLHVRFVIGVSEKSPTEYELKGKEVIINGKSETCVEVKGVSFI